jgi:MYXO-CTERM domain-containing protein
LDPATPQYLNGWNGNLRVTDYVSGDSMNGYVLEQTLQPSAGEDFLYDPPVVQTDPTDAFAQVGIYYHLTRMRDFFEANLGLDTSPASWRLVAAANVQEAGMPLDNAFFSPQGIGAPWNAPNLIAIGQGQSFDFAQDSDVFNHEFTHYVTENAIAYNAGGFHFDSYGRSPFSAAIDEGLSDYFACTVNGDPLLGEASLALLGVARDLQDTSKVCPDDMSGEAHNDGEIIGSTAWSLRDALGATLADDLVWRAASLLTFGASFGDFGRGLQQGADEMVTEGQLTAMQRSDVETMLTSRGLNECDPELPLHLGEPRSESLRGFNPNSCQQVRMNGFSRQSMFHYAVTPSADAEGVVINVQLDASAGADLLWAVHVRKNEHVAFEVGFPPTISDEDMVVENITDTQVSVTIDAQSTPAFEPGASYHVVITHQNCAPTTMTLSADDIEPMPMGQGGAGGTGGAPAQAADPPADQIIDSGCGCRVVSGSEPPVGWWLLLAGLSLAGLRRRHGPFAPRG